MMPQLPTGSSVTSPPFCDINCNRNSHKAWTLSYFLLLRLLE